MMTDYRYLAVLSDDPDGGVIATFPDVPEAITFGKDRNEACFAAAEALGLALRGYLAEGLALPQARQTGPSMIAPHLDDVLKIALVETARRAGMSVAKLRDLLDVKEWEANALLDPDAINSIAEMENALLMLGSKLHVAVEAA